MLLLDGDLDLDPASLPAFCDVAAATGADIVAGSKRHPLSEVRYPWRRRLFSAAYHALTAGLLGLRLSDTQAEELTATIRRELGRPEVAEWFAADFWDEIRNENDIISRCTIGTRRPDRVMIKGDRVAVVDYKFGSEKPKAHLKQIGEYMRLIAAMGYGQVEGYVWYLSLGEIVKVEADGSGDSQSDI